MQLSAGRLTQCCGLTTGAVLQRGALASLQRDEGLSAYTKRKFNEVQERQGKGGKKDYKKAQQKKRPKWART